MKALLTFVLLSACGCPQKPAPSSTSEPASTTSAPAPSTPNPGPGSTAGSAAGSATGSAAGSAGEPTPTWTKGPGIGESCGANDACAQGLTCVSYYGIAGARGPQFKTCEIKCQADSACPADHKCVTIADGPGQVCRK